MVRKDPLNDRGPAPPGGRPSVKTERPQPTTLFELRPEVEYLRLWNSVIVATKEDISKIELYAALGMPGLEISFLEDLRDRIDQVIEKERGAI